MSHFAPTLILSALAAGAPPDEEVCVQSDRVPRAWEERPAHAPDRGWSALRAALRLGRPRPLDLAAVVGGYAWEQPGAPDADPLAVAVQVAQHPDDPARALVWIGARAAVARSLGRPRDVIVLLDASPSMQSTLAGWRAGDALRSRHDLAVTAVERLRARLGPDDRLGVVGYWHGARVLVPLRPASEPVEPALEPPGAEARGWTGEPVATVAGLARRGVPCVERHVLVLADGDEGLGLDPRQRARIEASARAGATWSALTLAAAENGGTLEGLTWIGYGRYARAETPSDVWRFVRDALGRPPTVARDLVWEVRIAAPHRVLFKEEAPGTVPSGAVWTALYEIASPAPVTVAWRADSPAPGEWRRAGERVEDGVAVPFDRAPADLRFAWVLSEIVRWSHGEEVGLRRLAEVAAHAARPDHEGDRELVRLLERVTERTVAAP